MNQRPDLTKAPGRWVNLVKGEPIYYNSFHEALYAEDGSTMSMSEHYYNQWLGENK